MATPDQFKYYMIDGAGLYLYIDDAGALQRTLVKTPIKDTPEGWDKIQKSWMRGKDSNGIFSRFTSPVQFHGDAKKIIESLYFITGGVDFEAYCKFRIERRNDLPPNVWSYVLDFECELDFSTIKIGGELNNVYLTITGVAKGLEELLEANNSVDYKIPYDSDAKDIYHDGINLRAEQLFTIKEYSVLDNIFDNTYAPFVPITFDGLYPALNTYSVAAIDLLTSDPEQNKLFVPQIDITSGSVNLIGNVEYYNGFSAGVSIKLKFRLLIFRNQDYNTPVVDVEIYKDPNFLASGMSRNLFINATINQDFNIGDYVVVTYGVETSGAGAGNFDMTINVLDMYVRGNYKLGISTITSYSAYDFAKKMVEKVTEGKGTLQSTFLSTIDASSTDIAYKLFGLIPNRLRFMSGEAVRGNVQNPTIKISWDEFTQIMWSIYGVGFGTTSDKVIIERLDYFYNNTEIANIGEVKNLAISTATDYIYNTIKIGYPDRDYKDVNGLDIVHSEVNYTLGISRVTKEFNAIAPCIADPYQIEQLRGYRFKPTTDNQNDNEVVVIYCQAPPANPSDAYQIQRYSPSDNGGVYDPATFYNQPLYPVMMGYRHLPWLKSIKNSIPNGSQILRADFQSGLKNTEAYVKIGLPYFIYQDEPIYINNESEPPTPSKLFIPCVYDFEHEPVNNLFALIQQNPYGYITFTSQGTTYRGYILNNDMVSSETDVYTFKLLGKQL